MHTKECFSQAKAWGVPKKVKRFNFLRCCTSSIPPSKVVSVK